jgi:purine-binding chemotaxis protein CheW
MNGPPDDADEAGHRLHRAGAPLADRRVTVVVRGELFALPIREVQEILGPRPLTRVFRAPPCVPGVTSLRGEILTVLDLGVLLGLERGKPHPAEDARIVVVREAGPEGRRAGLLVEALGPVRDDAAVAPVPSTLPPRSRALLRGVLAERPLCGLLDVRLLFDVPELLALQGRSSAGADVR